MVDMNYQPHPASMILGFSSLSLELVGEVMTHLDYRSLIVASQVSCTLYAEAMRHIMRTVYLRNAEDLRIFAARMARLPHAVAHIRKIDIHWLSLAPLVSEQLFVLATHLPSATGLRHFLGDYRTEDMLSMMLPFSVYRWQSLCRLSLYRVAPTDLRTLDLVRQLPGQIHSLAISFRQLEENGWRWLESHRFSLQKVRIFGANFPEPIPGVFYSVMTLAVSVDCVDPSLVLAFPSVKQLSSGPKYAADKTVLGYAVDLRGWAQLQRLDGEWPIDSSRPYTLPDVWVDGRRHMNHSAAIKMGQLLKPRSLSIYGSLTDICQWDMQQPMWSGAIEALGVTARWTADDIQDEGSWIPDAASLVVSKESPSPPPPLSRLTHSYHLTLARGYTVSSIKISIYLGQLAEGSQSQSTSALDDVFRMQTLSHRRHLRHFSMRRRAIRDNQARSNSKI